MNVSHDPTRQRFEIRLDGNPAVAQYHRHGNTIVLTHTEVPPRLRGQGLGDLLARAAFDFARDNHLKVQIRCPFMDDWARHHPEYHDLLAGN